MVPATARAKSSTSDLVRLRARSWASKKSMSQKSEVERRKPKARLSTYDYVFRLGEFHLRGLTFSGVVDLEESRLAEVKHAGDEVGRETFARRVIGHDRVVVSLAGERNLVLG